MRLRSCRHGFALISTISIVVLLALGATVLLTLSSLNHRSHSQDKDLVQAQDNAKLAVIQALSQLQELSGADTRISANADLLSESNPKITGVWRSWEGSDRLPNGQPTIPHYAQKLVAGDAKAVSQTSPDDGRFLGWLTSPHQHLSPDTSDFAGISTTSDGNNVQLLGAHSTTEESEYIFVTPTSVGVDFEKGALAWFTSGENTKATLQPDTEETPSGSNDNDIIKWLERSRSNGQADYTYAGFEGLDEMGAGEVLPSKNSLALLRDDHFVPNFFDYGINGVGLLTNTATGGWRKDLSTFSELYETLPDTGFPTLQLSPFSPAQTSSKSNMETFPENPLLYPWYDYINQGGRHVVHKVSAVTSWSALADYMTQYQYLSSTGSDHSVMPYQYAVNVDAGQGWQNTTRRFPSFARLQLVYSLAVVEGTSGEYHPAIQITPALTIWNPYNVEISIPRYTKIMGSDLAPVQFDLNITGATNFSKTLTSEEVINGNSSFGTNRIYAFTISNDVTLQPGQSMVFGAASSSLNNGTWQLMLSPGFTGEIGFNCINFNNKTSIDILPADLSSTRMEVSSITHSETERFGISFNYNENISTIEQHSAIYSKDLFTEEEIESLFPTHDEAISSSLASLNSSGSVPFLVYTVGVNGISPVSLFSEHQHLNIKGMLQSNPIASNSQCGVNSYSGYFGGNIAHVAGTGANHPINSRYNTYMEEIDNWNAGYPIPESTSMNSSFLLTDTTATDGQTHCILAELPIRPLQSLAELQNFDATKNKPIPPFHLNVIGNSSAHPLLPSDAVSLDHPFADNLGHMCNDDSYTLNHVLFDDWFISSIAPDLNAFSSVESRSLTEVYEDFLDSNTALPNRFYKKTRQRSRLTTEDSVDILANNAEDPNNGFPYEHIASEIEVHGMFNINSTSVEAWKTLLRNTKGARIPYIMANGQTTLTDAHEDTYPYPRTSLSGSGGENMPNGYGTLTESQISALATEIVNEIRERGPFLSLSEFVNRRLDSTDLALAGVIQAALDTLSEASDDTNPYQQLQALAPNTDLSNIAGDTEYAYPEAAIGSPFFGVPGWIRQADILKPLAPILSARDDTFTIRAYGDSRNSSGEVKAQAWCEVIVQRSPDFVNPVDPSQSRLENLTQPVNELLGRRYKIVSFRWLDETEL